MVVLAVGISFYAVNHYQAMEDNKARIALIEPGSKQAVLTLPDGSTIDVQKERYKCNSRWRPSKI